MKHAYAIVLALVVLALVGIGLSGILHSLGLPTWLVIVLSLVAGVTLSHLFPDIPPRKDRAQS